MPNHVINILSFEGDKAKIRQMLEDIKDDECGLHSVDFNKIIPMPPGLDLEAGSCTQAGLAAYKDFLYVYTLGGTINTEHLSDIPVASERSFLKMRTDINHEDFALGKQAWNNLRQYGAATCTTGAMQIGVPNGTHTGMTDTSLPLCRMIASGFRPLGRNPSPS